ncbi:MAG: serine/threonine-protein kinase [Ignavibacteriaceae bacterium]
MNHNSGEILFEKFEIIECLKRDSYANVYLAIHIYLGKKIILKTLNTDDLSDQTILKRFKREAKILAQLDHPNLIKVLDFGTIKNHFYISFEYFESRNLREVIKQNSITDETKFYIFIQLLKALNIAHQNKIIHRDIKPENILIGTDYHLKIADFGLAMIQSDDKLTQDSSVVGTPSYMSPEQLRGEKSLQTDIFSAGIVAYELYSGSNPFSGNAVSDTVNKILNYDENIGTIDFNKLPEAVREAVKSMLRKSPKNRAKSIIEILDLLGIAGDIYKPVKSKDIFNFKYKIYAPAIFVIVLIIAVSFLFFNRLEENGKDTFENLPKNSELLSADSMGNSISNPIGSGNDISDKNNPNKTGAGAGIEKSIIGKLFVECLPYADIYIDGNKVDSTPLKDYIVLKTGRHLLKLVHPGYPPYIKKIFISSDRIESVSLNYSDVLGYLKCNIYPWGEIIINGVSKGVTPMSPIPLLNGKYDLTIKNPEYEDFEGKININIKDTLSFNLNFEKTGDSLSSK